MAARARPSNRPRGADFTVPLTVPGGALAGAEVVRELGPELTLPVWQVLRSVLLWAGEEPALRGDLFEPCAMADWERDLLQATWEPDVRAPLAVIVGELARPAESAADVVAYACLCVTEWCLAHGHVGTALAYAEAAALSWPQHPRYAWMAGRLLRRYGRLEEAAQWIRRAGKAAARVQDWETQTLAQNSLGNVLHDQDKNAQSLRTLHDALRLARRHRLRRMEGEILHDLLVVTTWAGPRETADEYALGAFEIYRDGHPRLAALAHDVACLWLFRGYYARALEVVKQLPSRFDLADERIRVWGVMARAAAGCGDTATFHQAAREVWALVGKTEAQIREAAALLEVAIGLTTLDAWDEADVAITRAVEIAKATYQLDVLRRAEPVITAIAERAAKRQHDPTSVQNARHADTLVKGFLSLLSGPAPVAV